MASCLGGVKGGAVERGKEDEEDDSVGEMILGFIAGSDHGPYEGRKAFLTRYEATSESPRAALPADLQ